MHPATESAMSPYAKKPKAGMPQIGVYDNGGDVAMSGFRKMAPSLDEEDPHLQEEDIPQYTHGGDPARGKAQPKDFNGGSVGGAQDTALAHPAYAAGQAPAMDAPTVAMPINKFPMDNGGDVKNINDGQHQVAILQTGERVLDRDEAARYRQQHGAKENTMRKISLYDDGGDVPKVDDEQLNSRVAPVLEPKEPAAPTEKEQAKEHVDNPGAQVSTSQPAQQLIPEERGTPQERAAIRTDKQNAMGSGDLISLGKAAINEAHLEPSTSDVNKSSGLQVGMPKVQDMYQPKAGGQLIPEGETPNEARDFRNMDRKTKLSDYDTRIQAARDAGDETTADKLTVAKAEYQKHQPWSDRSLGSKFGKIASTIGNVAGDVVAPSTMMLIPGTDLNRQMKERAAYNRIGTDTEADLREAQINAKETPKPKYEMKETLDTREGSPTKGQTVWAGVNENDPTDVRYSGAQVAPKAAGEPKAETREQHLNRYAELKNQVESGAQLSDQDQKEFNTLKTELTVPKATVDSYNRQIDAALYAAGVNENLWGNYHVQQGATAEEAKQSIADAKAFSGETYQQGGERRKINDETRKQDAKDKNALVYVETSNGVVLTNQYDLDHHEGAVKGAQVLSNAEPVKSGDVSKDKTALRQLTDVQTNVNRYEKVIKEDLPKVTEEDRKAMTTIMTIDKESGNGILTADVSGKPFGVGVSAGGGVFPQWSAEVASRKLDQARDLLSKLSPEAQRMMNAYLRTASSVPTYLKAIAGIGRSNKETLNLELANVPMPYFDQTTVSGRMSAFQDNIDQARSGFPNNLPGMKLIESEREKNNIKAPAPADVEKSGTLNGQPVYQLKNGKTVYADGKSVEVK